MRIFAGIPQVRCVTRQWGWRWRRRHFLAISVAIFSETLERKPALLYGDKQFAAGL